MLNMHVWVWFIVAAVGALAMVAVLAVSYKTWVKDLRRSPGLIATILGSLTAFFVIAGWLSIPPAASKFDVLKAGGLGAAAIVALYGIWLNDRRRRTEEERQKLESRRTDLDRQRVAEEGFARAIQLLGDPEPRTQVGALHSIAGISSIHPSRTQSAVDVICSYLRTPLTETRREESSANEEAFARPLSFADHEVRLTAQRVLAKVLENYPDMLDVTLDGADMEDIKLRRCNLEHLSVKWATVHLTNDANDKTFLKEVAVEHKVEFFDSTFYGDLLRIDKCDFRQGVNFRMARLTKRVWITSSSFGADLDLAHAMLEDTLSLDFETLQSFGTIWWIDKGSSLVRTDPCLGSGTRRILVPNSWWLDRHDEKEFWSFHPNVRSK